MKITFVQVWKSLLLTLYGLAGSVAVGLMLHGIGVFNPRGAEFAFVSFGAAGAFIFSVYHIRGLSNALTAAVCVSAVQFVVAASWVPVFNSAVWSFGVNLPVVWLAFLFERRLAAFHWGKFAVVGGVYGVMFVLLTLLVGVVQNIPDMPAALFRANFLDGLMIGLGMGLGVQAAETFIHSLAEKK
ncbi:MAG TPA: hypothetical protein VMM57_00830 [Bacteroidota bacterium]|nr:hypothetical protein [Bacteroidota bacterium]